MRQRDRSIVVFIWGVGVQPVIALETVSGEELEAEARLLGGADCLLRERTPAHKMIEHELWREGIRRKIF
jgi:hypothetical protein